MNLFVLILTPLLTALAIMLAAPQSARRVAMLGSLLTLGVAIDAAVRFGWGSSEQFQFPERIWELGETGIGLSVGIDSISLWLILLTALLQPLCVWGSFSAITERVKTYYAWLMVLEAAMLGAFVARDLIFFYICFEFTLLPMFVLISLYGSTNRRKAAIKFFLYTFTGSIIALAGLVYVAWRAADVGGAWTFDISELQRAAVTMTPREQVWVLGAMMAGFAVKVPLFPLHTWLPLAHTEAPTAGSVILAGVLLKLGTYAIFRFVIPFVPLAVVRYAEPISLVCVIGIIYGGLICWVQNDIKKLVAYSSVAHLGFCMLGMFALNGIGMSGSILYMINHGLSTGALFFCVGMMYERYHTRNLNEVGGLAARMPVWTFFMTLFTLSSVGLPGLNGFVGEFLCLLGAYQSGAAEQGVGGTPGPLGPWYAVIAGAGMIIAAMYLLAMLGRVAFGPLREPGGQGHGAHLARGGLPPDLSWREIGVLTPLAITCIALGIFPTPMLRTLEGPIGATLSIVGGVPTEGLGASAVASIDANAAQEDRP